jgi:peptidoglycan hydrolase-like protein with peptidoglycan-binding domain
MSGAHEPELTPSGTSTAPKRKRFGRRARAADADHASKDGEPVVAAVPDVDDATPEDAPGEATSSTEAPAPATTPPGAFGLERRKAVVWVVVGAVVIAFLGWLIGTQIDSPGDAAARSEAPTPSPILEPIARQKLSTEVRARGTGGFGSPRPVTLPASALSAGSVITSLPAPNDVVQEGGVLATISGRPVLALQGDAPMYRDLGPGMSGADVSQLEVALQRIGLSPGNVDGFYDAGTEAAVRALYTNAGFQPVVATAAQLEAAGLAPCPGNAGSCPGAGVVVPANEVFFVAGTPVQVGDVPATVGAEASGPLMTVSDSTPKVAGELRVAESKLVKPGMPVNIDQPDLGIKARGKVTSVAERPGTNGLDQFHVYFETSVDNAPDQLNGVSVRVIIPIKTTKNEELTVPVSAVVLDANGSSRVQVLTKNGLENVRVRTGLSADGYVVVKPVKKGSLTPGEKVVVGYRAPGG